MEDKDKELDLELFAGTEGNFIADEAYSEDEKDDDTIRGKYGKLKSNRQEAIRSKALEIEDKAEELYSEVINDEALTHFEDEYNGSLPSDIVEEIEQTLKEIQPEESGNREEAFEQLIMEDYMIDKKIITREDPILKNRRLKEVEEKMIKRLLQHVARLALPQDISKELLIAQRKIELSNILLDEKSYSQYRHKFINEKYKNILNSLPKLFRSEWEDGYLREAFMILHVLYKFGKGTETLDELTIAEIICSRNKILPSMQIYGIGFTEDFFLQLAKEGVFKKIQRLVTEEVLTSQLTDMTHFISSQLDGMRSKAKSGQEIDSKELKSLTEMLTKTQSMMDSLDNYKSEETIAYVYSDTSSNIDYSKQLNVERIEAEKMVPYDFQYYIACFDLDIDNKKEIFKGYLKYDEKERRYVAQKHPFLWDVPHNDKQAYKSFIDMLQNERDNGQYQKYVVLKLYNGEFQLEEKLQNN